MNTLDPRRVARDRQRRHLAEGYGAAASRAIRLALQANPHAARIYIAEAAEKASIAAHFGRLVIGQAYWVE